MRKTEWIKYFCRDLESSQPMRALDSVQAYSMAQQQRQQDSYSMAQQRQDSLQRQEMLSASGQQQKDGFQMGGPQRQELYSSTTKPTNSYLTNSVSTRCCTNKHKQWCCLVKPKQCKTYALATLTYLSHENITESFTRCW